MKTEAKTETPDSVPSTDLLGFLTELSDLCNKHRLQPETNGWLRDVVVRCMENGEQVEYFLDHRDRLRYRLNDKADA